MMINFYKLPLENVDKNCLKSFIKKIFAKGDPFKDINDLLDFCANLKEFSNEPFVRMCKEVLEKEFLEYRFNNYLNLITNKSEISLMEEAINNTSGSKLRGVQIHLE